MYSNQSIMEEWKDICLVPGFEEFTNYKISSTGLVSNNKNKLLNLSVSAGYFKVDLCQIPHKKSIRIHRLLALLFIPNPENYPCVDHADGCRTNNSLSNLRWCCISKNGMNAKKPDHNTTGHKNIILTTVKSVPYWRIQICVNGKQYSKHFKRETEVVPQHVIECRDKMLKELHKDFACFRI
jgi:hypothetical protein